MGSMTKDEINVSLFDELKAAQAEIAELRAQLARFREALNRIAYEQVNPHGDCGGDKALWCANEVIAMQKLARAALSGGDDEQN